MSLIHLITSGKGENADVHLLPCEIDADGEASVKKYFLIKSNQDEKNASFRGRPLAGSVLSIPEGFKGVVVKEKNKSFSDQQDRKIQVEKSFDHFTYWNLETSPSSSDAIRNAFTWLDVASVLHAPITSSPDEVVQSSNER